MHVILVVIGKHLQVNAVRKSMSHLLIVPVVTGGCAAGSAGGYNWEATPSGETASVACHEGYSGSATRACVDDEWGAVDDTGCSIEYVAFFIL